MNTLKRPSYKNEISLKIEKEIYNEKIRMAINQLGLGSSNSRIRDYAESEVRSAKNSIEILSSLKERG